MKCSLQEKKNRKLTDSLFMTRRV